ncbi:unnamed protein product, partial [Effrenium voratum]
MGGGMTEEKEQLVTQVKQIQRSQEDGKVKWEEFCSVLRTGNRDPARHTAQALRMFLEGYARGEMPQTPIYSQVLRLRGVPFQSEMSDVVAFLADFNIDASNIVIARGPDGKKTGEAYVTMPSVEIAEHALQVKQKQEIHGRYIELFRACEEDRDQARVYHDAYLRPGPTGGNDGGTGKEALVAEVKHVQRSSEEGRAKWERFCDALRNGNRDPSRHTCETLQAFTQAYRSGQDMDMVAMFICKDSRVLRLRGVPFQGGVPDVLAFLAEFSVQEPDILFIKKPDGRPTGEAFVSFQSPELAQRAM